MWKNVYYTFMPTTTVRAPGNIKLAGEHAVLEGHLALSAAIESHHATARVERGEPGTLKLTLRDLGAAATLDLRSLTELYEAYRKIDKNNPALGNPELIRYIEEKGAKFGECILPYATIAAVLLNQQGINPLGKHITIESNVPVKKGCGSSTACSTSFAVLLIGLSGKVLSDVKVINYAREGDRILHGNVCAGGIDVPPAYYGGYTSYEAGLARKEGIATNAKYILMDTGPKPHTSDMIHRVEELRRRDPAVTRRIMDEIGNCTRECMAALKEGNLKRLGVAMQENHELLRKLGVSSERLDLAVSIAVANGAYGAKLSGGGGGGIGIALVGPSSDSGKIIKALEKAGFWATLTSISMKGAKDSLVVPPNGL